MNSLLARQGLDHMSEHLGDIDPEYVETPTAQRRSTREAVTPLPKLQISVLLFLQLAGTIQTLVIYPFLSELVSTLDITRGDPRKVGYYVGIIGSVYFVCESVAILQWGRLSDHIGRKPVILTGLTGLLLSTISFGLSRSFWTLVISRSLAGLLCGNSVAGNSMLYELTDSTNIGQAVALMPITRSVGAILGPFIGGMLSRPYDHWPDLFRSPFWRRNAYFLPCGVAAVFLVIALVVACFFLTETVHRHKASAPRNRVETGGYMESDPLLAPTPASSEDPIALSSLLIRPILLSIANYVSLTVIGSAIEALRLVFYAAPIELGGLGFSPAVIGLCLSAFGLLSGIAHAHVFAHIIQRWVMRRVFLVGVSAFVPMLVIFPIMNLLARLWDWSPLVWAALGVQLVLYVVIGMSYSCIFIYTAASIAQAIGSSLSTSLFALSVQHDWMGGYAVYALLILLVFFPLGTGILLPERSWTEEQG